MGVALFFKKGKESALTSQEASFETKKTLEPIEVDLESSDYFKETRPLIPTIAISSEADLKPVDLEPVPEVISYQALPEPEPSPSLIEVDRIEELFSTKESKLPIVETVTYKSRVSWQKGRPAWLSDYASHFETSRHFIARSLNGKPDYLKQNVADGDQFNVLRKDKNIEFHLVIDTSSCKLWFYYRDLDTDEQVLLKTYRVSLGRSDNNKPSGLLTPLGKYSLGNKVATYKPKVMGYYKGQKVEMVRIFGTRWIPFEKELMGCTAPAKGFGLHGVPWGAKTNGDLDQDLSSIGKYESDGCIRLATEDIEEIFAIITTKPAIVELVRKYDASKMAKQ